MISFSSLIIFTLLVTEVVSYSLLNGVRVQSIRPNDSNTNENNDKNSIDLGQYIQSTNDRIMIIFGTYAADFNAIEYGQRLRYYWPILQKEKNIKKCCLILNCQVDAAIAYKQYIDIQDTTDTNIELYVDNTGTAGKAFGVEQGWLSDNKDINPFIKLFGMLFGFGAWATLPAVIGGYIGNPFIEQPWIIDAMAVGIRQNRWPTNALILNTNDNTIIEEYKFNNLPIVGSWKRKPLELATLRLQSMIGISLQHWNKLAPDQTALDSGVLTQLGGCLIIENGGTNVLYDWKDPGICAVANFEDILKKI